MVSSRCHKLSINNFVWEFPINTVVNMFTGVCTSSSMGRVTACVSSRPIFPHTHRHAPVPPRVPSEFCRHAPDSLPVYGSTDYKLPLQNLPLPLQSAVFNPLPRGEKITQADHAKIMVERSPKHCRTAACCCYSGNYFNDTIII